MIGEVEVLVLSARATVSVAEMDGDELGLADNVLGDALKPLLGSVKTTEEARRAGSNPAIGLAISRIYAICSIRQFNGDDVAPLRNIAQYKSVAKRLGAREINKLQEWAQPIYNPTEESSKNEDGDPSSE